MCLENKDNSVLLNNFLNILIVKGFSEKTIIAYNADLNIFFKFIKQYSAIYQTTIDGVFSNASLNLCSFWY